MEINLCCLGTVEKTIASDLFYLRAICIYKRLLFIIIVFFLFSIYPIFDFLHAYIVGFMTDLIPFHARSVGISYSELNLWISFLLGCD